MPLSPETPEFAADWAQKTGADGLILTGANFADSLSRIARARRAGIRRPILIGGALVLPYIAVVMANAAAPRRDGFSLMGPSLGTPELGPGDAAVHTSTRPGNTRS